MVFVRPDSYGLRMEIEPTYRAWHPWRYLAEHYPHITVVTRHRLPGHKMGLLDGNRIWICATSNQAERRTTLSHELGHLERGPVPTYLRAREERAVDDWAARRLIPLDRLSEALRWTRDTDELAEELWVDRQMVAHRLAHLEPMEVAELEHQLGDAWTLVA